MALLEDGTNQHQQAPKYIIVLVKQHNSVYERKYIKRWFDEDKLVHQWHLKDNLL